MECLGWWLPLALHSGFPALQILKGSCDDSSPWVSAALTGDTCLCWYWPLATEDQPLPLRACGQRTSNWKAALVSQLLKCITINPGEWCLPRRWEIIINSQIPESWLLSTKAESTEITYSKLSLAFLVRKVWRWFQLKCLLMSEAVIWIYL